MEPHAYSLPEFVEDLRRIRAQSPGEHDLIAAVRPLARRLALDKTGWLQDRMYDVDPAQGFSVYQLHDEPDHTLAVLAVSWAPGRGTPPHDHGTWGVVAGVEGPELNEFFERVDDRSRPGHAELRKIGEKLCGPGEVVGMPRTLIHSVRNTSDAVTVSLHVYGMHINHTGRSQFDLEKRTEMPFILRLAEVAEAS